MYSGPWLIYGSCTWAPLKGSEDLLIEKQRKIHIHKSRLVGSMRDCTVTFATAHTRSLVGHWSVHAN